MTRPPHPGTRRPRGLALVEFVITLPLLLLLLLATAEFGRAYVQYSILSHAVRDATRFVASAARTPTGAVDITAAVAAQTRNLAASGTIDGSGPALLPGLAAGNFEVGELPGNDVFVRGDYPYRPMIGGGMPRFHGTRAELAFTLRTEIAMPSVPSNPPVAAAP